MVLPPVGNCTLYLAIHDSYMEFHNISTAWSWLRMLRFVTETILRIPSWLKITHILIYYCNYLVVIAS